MRHGTATLAAALVMFAIATTTATASDEASPTKTIASYCSPSGDVCYGIFNRRGKVVLQITTAARYFNRYTLCVKLLPRGDGAEHSQRCGAFPLLRQRGPTWGSSVNFTKQFVGPAAHPSTPLPGRYRVTWRQVCARCDARAQRHSARGAPVGPSLFFRLPLS
jgi:hypothetical protein